MESRVHHRILRELGEKRWGKRFLNEFCRVTLIRGSGDPLIEPLIFLKRFLAPLSRRFTLLHSWVGEVGTVSWSGF